MRTVRRGACLLLAVLMLLAPPRAGAAVSVCFTAVNDTLLPLSDETMPFWSGGVLYVASAAFDGTDLGVYYARSRDKATAVLYKQRSVVIFDLAAGTIETNNGQTYSGAAITRGDTVFLPLDVLCRCFGLEYSYTRISYGYLVRIKSDSVVLSDATFIDAAGAPMAQRYARYERAQTEPEESAEMPTPAETTPTVTAARTVYLVVAVTDAAKTAPLLARLSGRAAYLFAPDAPADTDDLLRRLAAGGGAIALRVDAAAGAADALARIEAGNRRLWDAANVKTRLVRLDGASDETARRVAAAGYCPIRYALDFSGSSASAARMSARILAAADARGGRCCVFLGTDAKAGASLAPLLAALGDGNGTPARLNEVIAS